MEFGHKNQKSIIIALWIKIKLRKPPLKILPKDAILVSRLITIGKKKSLS
jgi:hypothetical protein